MQSVNNRKRSTELTAILAIFEAVSLLGLVYCLLALTGLQSAQATPSWRWVFYGGWFAVSAVCVYTMLHWKKWGAYGLAAATLIVTLVDIVQGSATWGGASLGLLIAFVVAVYLRPHWMDFE
jgi:hypothetical protein